MAQTGLGGGPDAGHPYSWDHHSGAVRLHAAYVRGSTLTMTIAVEVKDLKAYFGKTEALHGINIAIESKHATAVIGPSGCGKSTFIRCLNRMHETNPEASANGEVKIGGSDIYSMPAVDVRRKVGMVFQKPNPF